MKKFVTGILVFISVLLATAIAVPYFFKDKIYEKVKTELNKQMNAKVDFDDIDLSILKNIKNFPNIAVGIDDLSIIGKAPFDNDTLLQIGNAKASLDLMSVINGEQYKIEQIELSDAIINAIQNKEGIANWNILKEDETKKEEETRPFALALNKLILDNIQLNYDDIKSGTSLKIENLNHTGKGDFTATVFDYTSTTEIDKLSFKQGMVAYLKEAKLNVESKININQNEQKYSFKENRISLNDLGLILNGFVQLPDSLQTKMDIDFNADNTTFKSLLSLIPAIYTNEFDDIKASGNVALQGKINGILQGNNYPNFNALLKVDNGQFQYPKLPTSVNKVFIDASMIHTQGDLDKMIIDVPKLNFNLGNDPITAYLKIATPISNPDVDVAAKGKLNLADVQKFYPIDGVKKLSGIANVDVNIKAKKSDVDAKNYQNIKASGTIVANGIEYDSKDVPKPISVSNLQVNFSPQYVDVPQCKTTIGKSDFDIKAKLENVIAYVLSKEASITGNASIFSNRLDANEFLPDSSSAQKTTAQKAKEVIRLPKNIDFKGTANINELIYDQLNIKKLSGNINLKEEQLNINNLIGNLLGGSITANGFYNTQQDVPKANLSYDIQNFDIQQVYKFVHSAKQTAPIMKYISGAFLSNMDMKMALNPDLSPDLKSLDGMVQLKMPLANVKGVPALQQIVEQTKLKQLENLRIENLDIKATVSNGRVLVPPFETNVNNLKMTIGGSQGLDQTMDYAVAIDVPWKELGQASSFAQGLLAKNPIPSLNGMVPEIVRINLKVGGTFSKPIITIGKPDGTNGTGTMKDVVKEQVQQQVEQLKEEVKTQAKQTLDTIKTQVREEAKNKLQEIISGQKNPNDTTPQKSLQENVKDQLKNKFKWPR